MAKTHGLTHISLDVRDPERSLRFYEQVFGVREYYPDESSIQALGPGTHAVLAFERNVSSAGRKGGIEHFDHDGVSPVRPAREEIGTRLPRVGRAATTKSATIRSRRRPGRWFSAD
jgi:catechol 2,3-dioxygenase-like lactoylglutathione lyase family enzyme